ncbi:MAG: MgtC/SapB family protein [Pseudomonadota bacterium]|nr:MgtC/SapB family protein [Pseudomonadota bacterium]
MREIWDSTLSAYWSATEVSANAAIFLTLGGALILGLIVGYERTFHGRAVGMRTYGLVCMASAALTTFVGYPSLWYGGHSSAPAVVDPTRVVQGIVTGIGFLGAGIIMKDGLNIRGLTTAASVWSSSVIGVLVGVGFYGAAILLVALSLVCMMWVHRLENWLPSHSGIAVVVRFKHGATPLAETLEHAVRDQGYEIAPGSLSINMKDGLTEWHFIATSANREKHVPMTELASLLGAHERIDSFQLANCRN